MDYICTACNSGFQSIKGLNQHRRTCSLAEEQETLPDDAFARFAAKRARKRRKLEQLPLKDLGIETVHFDEANREPELITPTAPSIVEEPEPVLNAAGRIARKRRPTWKILESLPAPPTPVPDRPSPMSPANNPSPSSFIWCAVRTVTNLFGLYREFPTIPTHNPDDVLTIQDLAETQPPRSTLDAPFTVSRLTIPVADGAVSDAPSAYYPFTNSTVFGIMNWMWTGSAMKSIGEMTKLVNFLKSDSFRQDDLQDFEIARETSKLDKSLDFDATASSPNTPLDGWRQSDVTIQVPDGQKHAKESDIPTFTFPSLHYRSLTAIIQSIFEDPASKSFHYTPFKSFWKPSADAPPQRVYDELYSSDAMLEAHIALQQSPPEPGCQLERVIASLMFWSDSTHLADFGTASLWPLYLFFGNQSKWLRGKPRTASCHHAAYIPKLPAEFHDFFATLTGEAPSKGVLTHCRREVMHAVWSLLLDKEFLDAYKHGIVIECPDGIFRRFYPRIFTYSADYPEKALLATIRNLGSCPCPRCLVPKDKIPDMGMKYDDRRRKTMAREASESLWTKIKKARKYIYEEGFGVKSSKVENLLSSESLVPTMNAFSILQPFGFNIFKSLVVDFMHEFELGVWKAVFKHLLRILYVGGGSTIQALNERYRAVPTFGRSTIRRFSENASALKKLAARNYEDLLQCAMPVFEGLLDEPHNSNILSLLFTLAEWHALGKLRMHTETSVGWLQQATSDLGSQVRRFARHTCHFFATVELPSEEAARGRRQARKQPSSSGPDAPQGAPAPKTRKSVPFNMIMYKLHALGDYIPTITWFGTTDSYSTQPGELEHRRVKRFYARTNKNNAVHQMTRLERREQALRRLIRKKGKSIDVTSSIHGKKFQPIIDFQESESLPYTPPSVHHNISDSRNYHMNLIFFLSSNHGDPAIDDFRPKLEEHILARLQHPTWSGDGHEFSPEERQRVIIHNDRLYLHKIMRVNYTTYDVRRGQDSLSSRQRSDIMILAREEVEHLHPFEYARILGIFHVDVTYHGPGVATTPTSMEILWVRRFRVDSSYPAGFAKKRLHRVEFLDSSDPDAFGFLDPDEVIRGAHLIPAFHYQGTDCFLQGKSLARNSDELDDYRYFYVNIFVDRDMYMRYAGGGIGHHYQVNLNNERPEMIAEDEPIITQNPPCPPPDPPLMIAQEILVGPAVNEVESEDGSGIESGESECEWEEDDEREGDEDEGELAEDGEGGLVDEEDEQGYAPL